MKKNTKKVLIIVISMIAILIVVGAILAYLYIATDTFKTGQELFAKYLAQNVNDMVQTIDLNKIEEIENKIKENKNEQSITISYVENETTDNIMQLTLDTQNDPISQKYYGIIGLSMKQLEEPLKIEYMKEDDTYSLRFTNSIKQFFSIKNRNLKKLATNLGLDESQVENIPDSIDFGIISSLKELQLSKEEQTIEKDKYINLLYNSISKEKYTKAKNVVITVNGKTITANAYTLTLSMQDIKDLQIKILETLKQDEVLLAKLQILDEKLQQYIDESIKENFIESIQDSIDELKQEETNQENLTIIVYEQKQKTIRIKLEQNLDYLTIDTAEVEGKEQFNINYTNIDEENTQLTDEIKIVKENENKLTIEVSKIDGEEKESFLIDTEIIQNENNIKINYAIKKEENQLTFSRNIDILDTINYEVTLNSSNNIIFNNLDKEKIENIINTISGKLKEDYIDSLNIPLIGENSPDAFISAEAQLFNSQFEIYEGSEISAEEVKNLIDIVISHNKKEKSEQTERYVIISGEVQIDEENNTYNQLEKGATYKIEKQLDENGFIEEIIITKNEENPLE